MQVQSMPDKQLVRLYISGDEHALSELITRHRDKIYTSILFTVKERLWQKTSSRHLW